MSLYLGMRRALKGSLQNFIFERRPAGSCVANHRRAAISFAKSLISMESPTFFEAAM
jgi:hypothetical protein